MATQVKALQQRVHTVEMAFLGQLTTDLVHDLNNPLAYVLNNLKILSEYSAALKQIMGAYQTLAQELRSVNLSEPLQKLLSEIQEIHNQENISEVIADIDQALSDTNRGAQRMRELIQNVKRSMALNEA